MESNRDGIEKLVANNPSLSAAEMARELHLTRERVRQLLNAMGYTWEPGRWRRKRKAKAAKA